MIKQLWNRFARSAEQKALILMYHQVCERSTDPWDLAVAPENFEHQLRYLKSNYDVVPLDDLADGVRKGKLTRRMAAITFDDGFADNYQNAAPLLEAYDLPATFFITTSQLSSARLYWWDELESIIFHSPHLPSRLAIAFETEAFQYEFRRHSHLSSKMIQEIRNWRYGMDVVNERIDLYLRLWQRIQPLSVNAQREKLHTLRAWAAIEHLAFENATVMNADHLRKLSRSPLFSIGAHTVNHAMLSAQPVSVQRFEVSESHDAIERSLNKPVKAFAYPYGNYSSTTQALVKQSPFNYAVSTEPGAVTCDSDLFGLPRIQIKNWNEETFAFQLNKALPL